MAKISTYAKDTLVQDTDKWIGTDGPTGITKNFTPQILADNFNRTGKIALGGQVPYQFFAGNPASRQSGTISFPGGFGDNNAFSTVANLVLSKVNFGDNDVSDFIESLSGNAVFLYNLADVNKFAKFTVTSVTTRPTQTNFFDVGLSFIEGSGAFESNEYYGILEIGIADKEFIFTQSSAGSTWSINHNLNKFPSVTVVDSANSIVIGDITYNNKNTLTINFTSSFSGKAYLN